MNFEDEFDYVVIAELNLDEEEAKAFRSALMNLVYEELYKPLWRQYEEHVRKTLRIYLILIVLLVISIALNIFKKAG